MIEKPANKKIGDLLGIEDWLNFHKDYGFYYDDRYIKPDFKPEGLNCVDDRIEKNRKTRQKILEASMTELTGNFGDAISEAMVSMNKAIAEAHYSFVNELLDEGISFKEAERFVSTHIDLSNISLEEKEGKYFIVIKPRLREELFDE